MITKFIGSPYELVNASKIGLACVLNQALLDSKIPEYRINNPIFQSIHLVDKIGENTYKLEVTTPFKFNYILMYSDEGDPLGFTNINQLVDTETFQVKTIKVLFNFTIINEDYYISTNFVDYLGHETQNKLTHKILIDPIMRDRRALDRATLYGEKAKPSPYTNSIFSLARDSNLIHRYSGNISKGFKNIISDEILIDEGYYQNIIDFFNIKGDMWLIGSSGDNLQLYRLSDQHYEEFSIGLPPHLIGINFISINGEDGIYLYSTEEIIDAKSITPNLTILKNEKLVLDPIIKDLMIYSYTNVNGVKPISEKLKKIFEDLDIKELKFDLMYATDGLVIAQDLQESTTRLYTYYRSAPYIIQGLLEEVVVLTKDLILYKLKGDIAPNLYLYEINKNYTNYEYEGKSYILGSNGRYRRLDKISKNRPKDITQVSLTNLSSEGCLWSKELIGNKIKLKRL